jgi:hypothetical protein
MGREDRWGDPRDLSSGEENGVQKKRGETKVRVEEGDHLAMSIDRSTEIHSRSV